MSTQVVVTLPDDLYAQAQHWAALTRREVPQLLTEALALVLTPIGTPPADTPPVATLSDPRCSPSRRCRWLPSRGIVLISSSPSRGTILTTQEQASSGAHASLPAALGATV